MLIDHADINENDTSPFNLWVWFYLAPGGLIVEKEILVYDFYDLIGNVGGFLGLFLGVSVLSIYDGINDSWQKMKKK